MLNYYPLTLAQEDAPPPPSAPPATPAPSPTDATTTAPSGGAGGQNLPPAQPRSPFDGMFFIFLLGILVLMFFFSMRSQSKEKKRRQQMLEALKKGDRVQTVGGIIGTIADVRENEVVLKVDEGANVKLRFARSAIQTVVESKQSD